MAKSSFFSNLTKIADEAAKAEAADQALLAEFRSHSDATQPTEGFSLPVAPAGITLYGYQEAAVETILKFRSVILGFAPGMGKTPTALTAIAALAAEGKRSIVVVPPSLRVDPWKREAARFFPNLRVEMVEGTKKADLPDADLLIVPDSVVAARLTDSEEYVNHRGTKKVRQILSAEVREWAPDALFVDEAQRHKNRDAKRAKATLAVAEDILVRGGKVVELTGTLSVNNPAEVFMPIRIAGVAKALSGTEEWSDFLTRWCVTETVWTGRENVLVPAKEQPQHLMEELHERLRQIVYVRVERDEVLDMPDKVWATRALHLNGSLARYRRMEKDFINWIAETKGDKAALRAAKAEAITKLQALWHEAALAKAKAAAEYVAALVQQDEQVVVMGWHKDAIAALNEALADTEVHGRKVTTVQVVGGMSAEAKAEAQDTFRSGKADVLIGNITAAGTGLNLDNAAHLVFFQLPWSPGDLVQASDRIYRVTQRRDCTIHVVNALDTVDERMLDVLVNKAEVVDRINTGKAGETIDTESVQEAVLSEYGWED